MPENVELNKELLAVLARHGVVELPKEITAGGQPGVIGPINPVASYIKEIITGAQAFDEAILVRVGEALASLRK